ncbi:PAS domain-containing hybrid sensor histidine kinase/response regulator [Comamonas terrigena]|uniref:PAS domain-containing hybrid sensor histidine kinase/response regulator n=1 Tax=Comamonas terrigena TaxID=32013 RepID=UPI002447548A|nr:PAS domain-containing sensor histidine kinase [Comamonas terrigena]MDH1703030.1 ATP-binding protein [Comamonas terrigena]
MSRPDLSFLLQHEDPDATQDLLPPAPSLAPVYPNLDAWEATEHSADDPLAALIAELRNYQAELEIQNKVLDYSQAVAESASERFEALFSSVPLPLLVIDEHDIVIQANAMAHSAFQSPSQDRLLASFMPFVVPEDADRVAQAFLEARQQGRSEVHEVQFSVSQGHAMQGDLHIACIEIPQRTGPASAQFMCAVVDQGPLLAERQTLQERNTQLHASERRLEAVINTSMDAIICVDSQRRITVFNPTAATLFLCPVQEALGSRLERFLPDAAYALELAPLTTQAVLGEMTGRTASGRDIPVEVGISFERYGEGETTTVFARDLTSRKRAEAQRGELEVQLRESHKMQALGTLAGGIAHDFNNIVGAILGNVELAMADCAQNSPLQESLREIEKAGKRARDLVRQILTFSRNQPPQRRPVHAGEVLRDTERLLRVSLPPAIELQTHVPAQLPALLADPTQVEQALFNLATNAMHAIGEVRGMVRMEVELQDPEPRLRERLGLANSPYIVYTVQDNGPGMTPQTLQRIFEPFFTTKPVGQGTGLGLAVVHGVMRTHGGAVDVHSQPGLGSRFALYFPVAEGVELPPVVAEPPRASVVNKPAAGAMLADCHVMYVDDDEALVFLVKRLLKRRGYRVTGFSDPHEATQALHAAPQEYHLLVTDYNMPGYCGVDLVRAALQIRPDLPVALASGYITAEIEQQALSAGAQALIHKPNDVEELCATVDRLLHGASAEPQPPTA